MLLPSCSRGNVGWKGGRRREKGQRLKLEISFRLTARAASPHGIDSRLGVPRQEGKTMKQRGVENRETRETIRRAVTNERAWGNAVAHRQETRDEALGNLVERTTEDRRREIERETERAGESYFSCGGP